MEQIDKTEGTVIMAIILGLLLVMFIIVLPAIAGIKLFW